MIQYLTLAYTRGGESITSTVELTVEGEQNLDVVVGGGVSNKQVLATIDVSALALVFISSDQTITLKTNSSGSPDETITITAGKPFVWYTGCGWTNPLATDITALYLTRGAGDDATVKIRYGYDATP